MRNLTEIHEFDSFDNSEIDQNLNSSQDGFESDNVYLKYLMLGYDLGMSELLSHLAKFFPSYNTNISLPENVNVIYSNLKSQKDAGENLTDFEKTFVTIMERANKEIADMRRKQTGIAIKENLPIILIVLAVAIIIGKKMF